jgi:hypothetical protein
VLYSTLSIALPHDSLGLAIFQGPRLTFLEAHSLQTLPKPAEASAGFVLRCIDTFSPAVAVMQYSSDEAAEIRAAVLEALRASNRAVSEIAEQDLLASFGEPPIASKEELRQVMAILFPQIPMKRLFFSCLDAVAIGLHFETQRLLADD